MTTAGVRAGRRGLAGCAACCLALALLIGAVPATASPERIAQGAAAYKQWAIADIDRIVEAAERLDAAVKRGDVAAARQAWIDARVGYERSETFAEPYFPDSDKALDTWPDAKRGFHAIEVKLFAGDGKVPPAETEDLLQQAKLLQEGFAKQAFDGNTLIGGIASLAFEVGESKSKGGESKVSGTSLADMQHNVEGVDRAWHMVFADSLREKDAKLADRIDGQIAEVKTLVGVASLDQVDPEALEKKAELLAGSLADAAVALGYPAPKFEEEEGEGGQ
jgi:iron uptake system component EfeO